MIAAGLGWTIQGSWKLFKAWFSRILQELQSQCVNLSQSKNACKFGTQSVRGDIDGKVGGGTKKRRLVSVNSRKISRLHDLGKSPGNLLSSGGFLKSF